MQLSTEALIAALRGAADALEDYAEVGDTAPVPQKAPPKEAETPTPPPVAEPPQAPEPPKAVETAMPAAPEPWETEPPQAAPEPEVSADDIKSLYQSQAQAGQKIDMLSMLGELGVQRVTELDGEGRKKLYGMMKAAAS